MENYLTNFKNNLEDFLHPARAPSPADWQLPSGVNRGLWDYLHSPEVARGYDAGLAHSSLFQADERFCLRHFDRPGRLIDLGCGTGRLAVAFARRGGWVLAVDLSEEMLRVTGEKAAAAGAVVHRLKANLVELDALGDGSFNYAACLFSTLGMVTGSAERRRVVAHAYRLLRPGGKFVLHVHNRWFNFWDPQGRRWLLKNVIRSLAGSAAAGDRHQPPHQGIAGLTLHLFTRREAVRLLREAGFRIVEVLPVGLGTEGRLSRPWWFGWLRAYGYLIAADR
jgi:ubiquinone/menaquinone biosynthesis C-methylase UbiE